MPPDAVFNAVMRRRADLEFTSGWRNAVAEASRGRPLRLRLARWFHLICVAAPPTAVFFTLTPSSALFPLALLCATLLSLRMGIQAWLTRRSLRTTLLKSLLNPVVIVPAALILSSPVGGSLADLWSNANPFTGVGGGLLLAFAALLRMYSFRLAPFVSSPFWRLLLIAPSLAFIPGNMLFLLSGVCEPRHELLVPTAFVLAVELLPVLTAAGSDGHGVWRTSWDELRGESGPQFTDQYGTWRTTWAGLRGESSLKYRTAVACWAWDTVLSRPARPDYGAVTAMAEFAWHSYRGALADRRPLSILLRRQLFDGACEALPWLAMADDALLAVEANAARVPPEHQTVVLRAHLTARAMVEATAVMAWGHLDRPEEAYLAARDVARDFRLLGKPEWADLYRVCAAAVSARHAENPNRAAADLRELLRERAVTGRYGTPAHHAAVQLTALLAHHVDLRKPALELLAGVSQMPHPGVKHLENDGISKWAVGALWDAAIYDLNRYFLGRDFFEAYGETSPFRNTRSPHPGEPFPGKGLADIVPPVPTSSCEDPSALTREAITLLDVLIDRYGDQQPWSRAEQDHLDAQETTMRVAEQLRALQHILHDHPPPTELDQLVAKRRLATETVDFLLKEDPDPSGALRKAFTHTENVRAAKLSSDLALRAAEKGPANGPRDSPYERVNPQSDRYMLSPRALARVRTGNAGSGELDRQRGVLDFGQVRALLATTDDRALLVSYWHDAHRTLVFLLRAHDPAPTLVSVPLTGKDLEDLEVVLRSIQSDDRRLAPAPWDAACQPLVSMLAEHAEPGEMVWVVPDGILHHVPLHAIALPDGRALLERNPVCFFPSASLMQFCLVGTRPAVPSSVAVVADRTSDDPLPFAGLEAATVAAHFPDVIRPSGKHELLGLLATRSLDVLHLTCHGYFEPGRPQAAAVVLGQGEELTAEDVLDLRMQVGLVTIAACESGLGSLDLAEERLGLVRAFVQAGASAVLASLWPVDDFSACLLMEGFYAGLRQGLPRAEALRRAQLALRAATARDVRQYCLRQRDLLGDPDDQAANEAVLAHFAALPPDLLVFDDPYHWAVFQLYGDGR